MKRIAISLLLAVLVFTFGCALASGEQIPVRVSYDINRWDHFWKPGEKVLARTEGSRARVDSVLQAIDQASAGTLIREGADNDTIEIQFADYQRMLQDGVEIQAQVFDDIGTYVWAVGLPDEQSITQEEAKRISCQLMMEEAGISEEQMCHFYPHFTYETGDPEHPFWHITWMPFDQGSSISEIFDVAVYAQDGSICGYRIAVPVG